MKFFCSILTTFLALAFLSCSSCPGREAGLEDGEAKGVLRVFVLPAVETYSADSPPRRVYLAVSLGYYGDASGMELARSSSVVSEAVRYAAGSFTAAEINSVEGYERLRGEILSRVNRRLRAGRVDRVVIRSVSVR